MRSRRGPAAVVAAGLLGGAGVGLVSACGGAAAVFHPAGSPAAGSGPASLSARAAPAGAGIDFETPLPAAKLQRAVVLGYEGYARSTWADRTVTGPVRYFDTAVTGVYFGNGAAVASCVDASGRRYLEEVAEGRRADGAWFVTHAATYPAASSQGATCR